MFLFSLYFDEFKVNGVGEVSQCSIFFSYHNSNVFYWQLCAIRIRYPVDDGNTMLTCCVYSTKLFSLSTVLHAIIAPALQRLQRGVHLQCGVKFVSSLYDVNADMKARLEFVSFI